MELFRFEASDAIALAPWESARLLAGGEATIDLGLGRAQAEVLGSGVVEIRARGRTYRVDLEALREHSRRRSVLVVEPSGYYYEAEVRARRYYKLVPLEGTAPTLEIDGIHMHRVQGATPLQDAEAKVRLAGVRRGDKVLEVGTGLGYTASYSLRRGASLVVTIEVDENVLWVAERNPWSRDLGSGRVAIVLGDAVEVIDDVIEAFGTFDKVIHDPPRFTSETGPLYSAAFYEKLFRALRPGGRLFHYTGEPGRSRGLSFPSRVKALLKEVGFEGVMYAEEVYGVVARKPIRRP